jgi:hypothetical protein
VATNSITSRAAWALSIAGTVLVLANWYTKPAAALAWGAALAMFFVMIVVLCLAQLHVRWSRGDAAAVRSLALISSAVVFGALIMSVPLGVKLAHSYGFVADPGSGHRVAMIVVGAYLAVTGNAMPRMLPPLSSMQCDGARTQAFLRLAGRAWVIAGLGFSIAWLMLPRDAAEPVSTMLIAAAMVVTIVQVLRLRRPRHPARGLS